MRRPNGRARAATARATCPKEMSPRVWPHSRGNCERYGRPSAQRPSRTYRSMSVSRRYVARISISAWSATSSMNVSGTLVTGMPRAVAAATSTESTPTMPSEMTRHRSRPSIMRLVMRRALA